MLTPQSVVAAVPHQISSNLAGETVILNLDSSVYYGLDAVGTRIWSLLQARHTVGEIRDALVAEYQVEPERAQADLIALLERLREAGLVEIKDGISA